VFDAIAAAARRIGVRAHIARGSLHGPGPVQGRPAPGYRADLVVWPGDDLADVLDPLAGLVLGPERRARHVLVEGAFVVRDGRLLGADMDALRRDLARRARRLSPEDAR
jgi:cytosine/adenosine deaminase-related metal-dependent hydrolase